jgi:hypothetical protein
VANVAKAAACNAAAATAAAVLISCGWHIANHKAKPHGIKPLALEVI